MGAVRLLSSLRLHLARRPKVGDVLRMAGEIAFVGLLVLTLESLGRLPLDAAGDVVGVFLLLSFGAFLVGAARADRAPLTRAVGLRIGAGLKRGLQRLEPSAGVAFRLPEDPEPGPWIPHLAPTLAVGALALLAVGLGPWLLDALDWVRYEVAMTPYFVLLLVLWALFGILTSLGFLAIRTLSQLPRLGIGARPAVRVLPGVAVWVLLIVGFSMLPGWVAIALFAVTAALASRPALRSPPRTYWMWRRDEQGKVLAAPVLTYVRVAWVATILATLFVVLLGQMPRFLFAYPPEGPHTITIGLGLSASAASIFLLLHGALFLARMVPAPSLAPETPLLRTLWWPGGEDMPGWVDDAKPYGWHAVTAAERPEDGHDLSVGVEGDPRRFRPPSEEAREDPLFLLDRRFHIVKRRVFFRRFQVLYKEVTKPPQEAGTGYLFCPHAWPVPAVLQDGATTTEDGHTVFGGKHVGPMYAQVFEPRVRRYLHEVLQALKVDVIFWDGNVAWAPLRAVFGVLFESYDQGRLPVEERHFVGLTRAQVLIQEAEDVDQVLKDPLPEVEGGPLPLRARVLIVKRDDPGQRDDTPVRDPGSRMPVDMLA